MDPDEPFDVLRAGVTNFNAQRVGIIGDDHNTREDASDLPDEALHAFEGVDLIVHLGHGGDDADVRWAALNRLEKIAPVLGVQDYSSATDGTTHLSDADGTRVRGVTRVVDLGRGLHLGLVHDMEQPPGPKIPAKRGELPALGGLPTMQLVQDKFRAPVQVVAFGATHRPAVALSGGVMFVNPGSPTYPRGPGRKRSERALGTVAILDISEDALICEIIDLAHLGTPPGAAAT